MPSPESDVPGFEDEDLSATVTKLNRIKAKNRARLANSELTRAFLNSGLALTKDVFSLGGGDPAESVPPTLAYLSRPRVLSRAREDYPELVPTEAKFRDRWAGHQDFLEDFVKDRGNRIDEDFALTAEDRDKLQNLKEFSPPAPRIRR